MKKIILIMAFSFLTGPVGAEETPFEQTLDQIHLELYQDIPDQRRAELLYEKAVLMFDSGWGNITPTGALISAIHYAPENEKYKEYLREIYNEYWADRVIGDEPKGAKEIKSEIESILDISPELDILSIGDAWVPVSMGCLSFGDMTVSEENISWTNGQKTTYRIIEQNYNTCLLELTSSPLPQFNNSEYQFMECAKDNFIDDRENELEVSFYQSQQQLENSRNGVQGNDPMWGMYTLRINNYKEK